MRAQRRKTDSKTGKHTLCEPAQAKRTWACHKSHFVEIYRKNAARPFRARHFVRARNLTIAMFCGNLQDKMPHTTLPTSIEHRAFSLLLQEPFSVATLFRE